MSIITISNGKLTVQISTKGAELQSIKDAQGVERLWHGDPAVWSGRAPVLFPMAGGLREDTYYLDGEKYTMPKHGTVRKAEWELESQTDDEATFIITAKHEGFPFEYALRARYALKDNALQVEYIVDNKDTKEFCYGIGAHEAYATPEGIEAYEIAFDQPETLANYELVGNLIKTEPVIMAENAETLPLKYDYFAVDALVFRTLKSRGVTLQSKLHDRKLRVDFPECSVLMLWTKPGANYICIEPWVNAPDFVDADMNIRNKPGVITLGPGESKTTVHTITVL